MGATVSAAKVESDGAVTILDGRAEQDEAITAEDVKDAEKLARLLARALSSIAALKRAWVPRRVYFHDVSTSGTAGVPVSHHLEHGLGGRVNWWTVDWDLYGDLEPILGRDDALTTDTTLVLTSYAAGTMTICVEAAG